MKNVSINRQVHFIYRGGIQDEKMGSIILPGSINIQLQKGNGSKNG
jgi:hypothetical protein